MFQARQRANPRFMGLKVQFSLDPIRRFFFDSTGTNFGSEALGRFPRNMVSLSHFFHLHVLRQRDHFVILRRALHTEGSAGGAALFAMWLSHWQRGTAWRSSTSFHHYPFRRRGVLQAWRSDGSDSSICSNPWLKNQRASSHELR